MYKGMIYMKRVTAALLAASISFLMLCGCSNTGGTASSESSNQITSENNGQNPASSTAASESGTASAPSDSSVSESSVSEYDIKFSELMDSMDFGDYESFAKSFTDDSDNNYVKMSYEGLKQGFTYDRQVCIGIDKGIYYYLFLMTSEGKTQATVVSLEYNKEENRFYIKMTTDTLKKEDELMQSYICPECSGKGEIDADGKTEQCPGCQGLGIVFP